MAPTYLMLLWHQHQPYYKDLVENRYTMPWVRLHALKDYYGMVAELREFPSVHVTFNLVPSLVSQLEDYAFERAREESFEIAFRPASELTGAERERLLHYAFQVNRENLLSRYPRFLELYEKANPAKLGVQLAEALTEPEIRDLQVLSQLAWFEETWLESDSEIRLLVEKERGFTEADKSLLRFKEVDLIRAVLEEHRAAAKRGQIEISTSPFYHPILPLLCDTEVARESHPGVPLPRRRFRYPDDARAQLRGARELHARTFGQPPAGFWPSEGSLSDEVLDLAAAEGFQWAATDEGVLSRSLGVGFSREADGTVSGGAELYRPHRVETKSGPVTIFFRDHEISDLIGFVYSSLPPQDAAASLMDRIRRAGRSTGNRPAVVSVILDGENAWEFYPRNGRPFLRAFYAMLARDPEIRAVTASEALNLCEPGKLLHLVPGSWINSNFDVWIGAEEDNRAWDLLSGARAFFAASAVAPGVDPEKLHLAEQELWIAEGSDWCWWYGPEHSTANDEEFDRLYRKHLSNVYGLLGASPPDELAVPLKRPRGKAQRIEPSAKIEAVIDGAVTNYFEWLGAGAYLTDLASGSMHGPALPLDGVYFGFSDSAFYLRLDFNPAFLRSRPEFELRLGLDGASGLRLQAQMGRRTLRSIRLWKNEAPVSHESMTDSLEIAFGSVFELRADHTLVGAKPDEQLNLQVSVWENAVPVQVVPQEGWLNLRLRVEPSTW